MEWIGTITTMEEPLGELISVHIPGPAPRDSDQWV